MRLLLAGALVGVGLWAAPPAAAGCDYDQRTITCDTRPRASDGSYTSCTLHLKIIGGAEADCVRVCPPLVEFGAPEPYIEGRPCGLLPEPAPQSVSAVHPE